METLKGRLFIRSQNRLEFDVYIMRCEGIAGFIDMLSPEDVLSYPMNPYALRTCAVGTSCYVFTDLKLNIVEFSVFRCTISWYITNYNKFLVHYKLATRMKN